MHMGLSRLLAGHRSRLCAKAAGILIALATLPEVSPIALAQPRSIHPNPDWPCRQILVGQVSLAAVWSGPPIEGVKWRNDPTTAEIVARLAARRMPLDEAERLVKDFASSQGSDKATKLIAVFAGLFETLNDERTQVIEGLLRFGAKQRELAEKIRTEKGLLQAQAPKVPPDSKQNADAAARELEWDLRIFDDRRQSIAFVCETPTVIEQRLFALARVIQSNLG